MSHPERIVPDETEPGIVALHLKRYEFALPLCAGKDVLDAGCGVGYGTAFLAGGARRAVGVDLSEQAVAYARARYAAPNVEFIRGDLLQLDLPSTSFDVACAFETIEHVADQERLLAQLARVLRADGVLLVSTPRADETTRRPDNPFHEVELSARDFERLLRRRFEQVELYGQRRLQTRRHRADAAARRARPAPPAATPPGRRTPRPRNALDRGGLERRHRHLAGQPRSRDRAGGRMPAAAAVKIAHLVIGQRLLGGETVALQLARAAAARGDEVAFVVLAEGAFAEAVRREGFPVHAVDVSRTFRVGGLAALARLLRRTGVDVLHTHTQLAPNILGRLAARLAGAAVVSHLHIENYFRPNAVARTIHRGLDNATARLCARIVVVSDATLRALERQGYPAGRMEVVYNGIELPAADSNGDLRAELGLPTDALVVAQVARLAEVKGQRVLIDALSRVPDARAVLFGDDIEQGGAYRAELARHAERVGLADRVVFAGHRSDAADLAGSADVVVLPSSTEGLPVVLLKAMARGRAVVATPVGGTAELVVEGETGLLVPPCDEQALARALGALLGDPARRRSMGEAGRRRVAERFSEETMTRRVLEIYDEVLRSRR